MIMSTTVLRLRLPRFALTAFAAFAAFAAVAGASATHAQAGWVLSEQQIADEIGGLGDGIDARDRFGMALASLGDLDGDGIGDLAVGAEQDDDGGLNRGAVWILFLNADGTVKSEQKISSTSGGLVGSLGNGDSFGVSASSLGDLDGDGVSDLAVGAWNDDDGGLNRGAVWILFLNSDGTVKSEQKISSTSGGLVGPIRNGDAFGYSVDRVGDLDGDGVIDLAAGSMWDDDGGLRRGAIWILFLNSDGTVKAEQKISATSGGLVGPLSDQDTIGVSLAGLGDLDGDGIGDLASGADHDDDGGNERGAVWILFLNSDGTVKAEQKISATEGGLTAALLDDSYFGIGMGGVGDLDGDGTIDLAVGLGGSTGGGSGEGAIWILFLKPDGTVRGVQEISSVDGGFGGTLTSSSYLGFACEGLGDHDGDGYFDLVGAAPYADDGGVDAGSIWVMHLRGVPSVSATLRNPDLGGHVNPLVYAVTSPPVLGLDYVATIATGGGVGAALLGYAAPLTMATGWGNLLVDTLDPIGELLGVPSAFGDPAVIRVSVPDLPALCGCEIATQGVVFRGGGVFELTNAQDLVLGR
jgi:hypothetical protein